MKTATLSIVRNNLFEIQNQSVPYSPVNEYGLDRRVGSSRPYSRVSVEMQKKELYKGILIISCTGNYSPKQCDIDECDVGV